MIQKVILFVIFECTVIIFVRCEVGDRGVLYYTNVWTVQLSQNGGGVLEKFRMLEKFEIVRQDSDIPGLHLIIHRRHPRRGKYENKNFTNILLNYDGILWAEQMSVHRMELRFARCPGKFGSNTSNYKRLMNDTFFSKQWYLQDCRKSGHQMQNDLNVLPVWHRYKIFGHGVKVVIVDSGVQIDHSDLKTNYDPEYGYDFMVNHVSPTPKRFLLVLRSAHGTQTAGIVAMQANNKICGVGIAPLVTLGAARISSIDRLSTSITEARGLLFKVKDVDISNNSWGPLDNGKILPPLFPFIASAIKEGIVKGRRSKGVIYIFAGGNGKLSGDTCAHDSYACSMYTITVAGVQYNGNPVYYSERCSNILVTAYSGGSTPIPFWANIVTTTNFFPSCTTMFTGTSAAAPIISGIAALILEAKYDAVFNRDLAFRIRVPTNGCKYLPSEVNYIEHVQLLVSVEHPRRGAIQILLVSPSGTQTLLMDARRLDRSKLGLQRWVLDTVHLWGESPEGVWSIFFYDTISRRDYEGIVTEVVLLIHGTKFKPSHYDGRRTYYRFT